MRRESYNFAPTRRRRPGLGTILLVILVVILGFLAYLGLAKREAPLERIEQDVTNAIPAR